MKKARRIIVLVICMALLGLMLAGCGGRYKIIVKGDQSLIDEAPKSAKAGETVTVYTVVIADGELIFDCNTDFTQVSEGVYEFVMPEHNVEISGYVSTAGFPGS